MRYKTPDQKKEPLRLSVDGQEERREKAAAAAPPAQKQQRARRRPRASEKENEPVDENAGSKAADAATAPPVSTEKASAPPAKRPRRALHALN